MDLLKIGLTFPTGCPKRKCNWRFCVLFPRLVKPGSRFRTKTSVKRNGFRELSFLFCPFFLIKNWGFCRYIKKNFCMIVVLSKTKHYYKNTQMKNTFCFKNFRFKWEVGQAITWFSKSNTFDIFISPLSALVCEYLSQFYPKNVSFIFVHFSTSMLSSVEKCPEL